MRHLKGGISKDALRLEAGRNAQTNSMELRWLGLEVVLFVSRLIGEDVSRTAIAAQVPQASIIIIIIRNIKRLSAAAKKS